MAPSGAISLPTARDSTREEGSGNADVVEAEEEEVEGGSARAEETDDAALLPLLPPYV